MREAYVQQIKDSGVSFKQFEESLGQLKQQLAA